MAGRHSPTFAVRLWVRKGCYGGGRKDGIRKKALMEREGLNVAQGRDQYDKSINAMEATESLP